MDINIHRINDYLDWLKQKLFLDFNADKAKTRIVKRGYVYHCNFGRNIGSEQEKLRPCVVIQHFEGNRNSPNTIVAPVTHTHSHLDIVVPIEDKFDADGNKILDGHVLLGNIVTVSKARLGDEITQLSKDEMNSVDESLMKSVGVYWRVEKLQKQLADKDVYIEKLKLKREELLNEVTELRAKLNNK